MPGPPDAPAVDALAAALGLRVQWWHPSPCGRGARNRDTGPCPSVAVFRSPAGADVASYVFGTGGYRIGAEVGFDPDWRAVVARAGELARRAG